MSLYPATLVSVMFVKTFLMLVLILCVRVSNFNSYGQSLYVTAILDGERLVLSSGERIKLAGVDALEKFGKAEAIGEAVRLGVDPESVVAKGGIESVYLKLLVESKEILVSYVQTEINSEADKHTFRPAYVSVLTQQGEIAFIVNRKMIQEGFAMVDRELPFYYFEDFLQLQLKAMEERKGMWAYNDKPTENLRPGTALPSGTADFNSECRRYTSCVWVSMENIEVGYWKSVHGENCPCAQ